MYEARKSTDSTIAASITPRCTFQLRAFALMKPATSSTLTALLSTALIRANTWGSHPAGGCTCTRPKVATKANTTAEKIQIARFAGTSAMRSSAGGKPPRGSFAMALPRFARA